MADVCAVCLAKPKGKLLCPSCGAVFSPPVIVDRLRDMGLLRPGTYVQCPRCFEGVMPFWSETGREWRPCPLCIPRDLARMDEETSDATGT